MTDGPMSTAREPQSCLGALNTLAFASLFTFLGGGLILVLSVLPLLDWVRAPSWPETPCRITAFGNSYLSYEYEYEGETYSSSQYDFDFFDRGFFDNFERIKEDLPVGAETVCYVNPVYPPDAVLSLEFNGSYFKGLIVGTPFFLVGLLFSFFPLRTLFRKLRALGSVDTPRQPGD